MRFSANVLEICAGCGGLSAGLTQAGWHVATAVEVNRWAAATYRQNFPHTHVLQSDVRQVSFKRFRGHVDLVAGGPPCQPYSCTGKRRGCNDHRDLIPQFIRAIAEVRPRAFLMENVPGLLSVKHRLYLGELREQLAMLGYHIYTAVLDASHYGVPQRRKRFFLVGFLDNIAFTFPRPCREWPSCVAEALADVPEDDPNPTIVTYAMRPRLRQSPYAGLLLNGRGRLLKLDELAWTILARSNGSGSHVYDDEGILLAYHDHLVAGGKPRTGQVEGVRRLTAAEMARLQSFADDFRFAGPRSARCQQIGNAVPPKLSAAVGAAIYQAIQQGQAGTYGEKVLR